MKEKRKSLKKEKELDYHYYGFILVECKLYKTLTKI